MRDVGMLRKVEATAVFLFFLQAVRVLFSVLFGVIYDTVFEETFPLVTVGGILLAIVAALAAPLVAPRRRVAGVLWGTALVAALARVPVTLNLPTVRLWGSIVVIACATVYAATLVQHDAGRFSRSWILALVADQLLRTAGNTFDLALRPWWWPVQLALAVVVGVAGWRIRVADRAGSDPERRVHAVSPVGGLALGALLFLETSLLDFPNGVARWTGIPYEAAAPLLMLATVLPLLPAVRRSAQRLLRGPLGGLGLLLLVLAGLAGGRMAGGLAGLVGLLLAQFLLLLLLFRLARPGERGGGRVAMALGFLLFLVLNLAYAFTFTYPYTVPAFEGLGLPIVLAAGLVAALPALRAPADLVAAQDRQIDRLQWLLVAVLVAITTIVAWPCPSTGLETGELRVGTYNVHYGYNTTWQLNLEEMARTIEDSGANVVMLQEVDTCRITSYGVDDALWLARRLGMRAIYQPTLEGLSGIALLSRFPVLVADGALLESELEQTGIVHGRLWVGTQEIDAYGVWLGLAPDERDRQLADALEFIDGATPALFGGDLNATPDSPVYARLVEVGFVDAFVELGVDPVPTSPAIEPEYRVDYVWGRGLEPVDAAVLDSLASDHLMVVTEWRMP